VPVVQEFLRFIHSKQGQQIVKKDGFVPLNQALLDETKAAYEDDWRLRRARSAGFQPARAVGVPPTVCRRPEARGRCRRDARAPYRKKSDNPGTRSP
jgi:hypothetical protein